MFASILNRRVAFPGLFAGPRKGGVTQATGSLLANNQTCAWAWPFMVDDVHFRSWGPETVVQIRISAPTCMRSATRLQEPTGTPACIPLLPKSCFRDQRIGSPNLDSGNLVE